MVKKKKLTDKQYANRIVKMLEDVDYISAFITYVHFEDEFELTDKQQENFDGLAEGIWERFGEVTG